MEREYKDFSIPAAKKLKMLEEENRRLKKLLAERDLENYALKEIVKGSF
jgi:putative transposase